MASKNEEEIRKISVELRFLEQTSAVAGYTKVASMPVRLIYRLLSAMPVLDYDVLNRFAY